MEKCLIKISSKKFFILQLLLRSVSGILSLTAAIVMVTDKQTSALAGYSMSATFTLAPELKFFAAGNFASSAYLLLSLPLVPKLRGSFLHHVADLTCNCSIMSPSSAESLPFSQRFLSVHIAMMIMALTISAASVGASIGLLAKNGNNKIGWAGVCSYFQKFCNSAEVSIGFSFAAFLLFFMSCLLSQGFALKAKGREEQQHYGL